MDDDDDIANEKSQTLYSRQSESGEIEKFVFEDYKIVKLIGRGTFGKVYLVKN